MFQEKSIVKKYKLESDEYQFTWYSFLKVGDVLAAQKKVEVDSASKLWEQGGFTVSWKYCLNLYSLRRLKGAGKFTHISLRFPVFGKCLKWVFQVFKVGVSSVLSDCCEKRLLRSKKDYQGQILVNYSCHGWSFLWVGESALRKTPKRRFSWYLEYGWGS